VIYRNISDIVTDPVLEEEYYLIARDERSADESGSLYRLEGYQLFILLSLSNGS